jgi:hypothetical protein
MLKILFAVLGLAIMTALTPAETRASDPSVIVQAFNSALNAHDIDAALALVSDEAILQDRGQTITGRTQIRSWIVSLAAQNFHGRVVGPVTITGETIVQRRDILIDDWRRLGLDPLPTRTEFVVRDGMVHSFTSTLFPEAQTRLQQALARGSLPRTGGSALKQIAAVAIVLVVVGLGIRRWRTAIEAIR